MGPSPRGRGKTVLKTRLDCKGNRTSQKTELNNHSKFPVQNQGSSKEGGGP